MPASAADFGLPSGGLVPESVMREAVWARAKGVMANKGKTLPPVAALEARA